jgi:hypothetical protein
MIMTLYRPKTVAILNTTTLQTNNNLTPWILTSLEKLIVAHLFKKSQSYHWTRMFVTVFTTARHRSLSRASWIQFTPSHSSVRAISISSFHLRLGLPSGLLPSTFSTNVLYIHMTYPMPATFPPHLILLNFIILAWRGVQFWSFSLWSFLQSPVPSSLSNPNIILRKRSQTPLPLMRETKFYTQ